MGAAGEHVLVEQRVAGVGVLHPHAQPGKPQQENAAHPSDEKRQSYDCEHIDYLFQCGIVLQAYRIEGFVDVAQEKVGERVARNILRGQGDRIACR